MQRLLYVLLKLMNESLLYIRYATYDSDFIFRRAKYIFLIDVLVGNSFFLFCEQNLMKRHAKMSLMLGKNRKINNEFNNLII